MSAFRQALCSRWSAVRIQEYEVVLQGNFPSVLYFALAWIRNVPQPDVSSRKFVLRSLTSRTGFKNVGCRTYVTWATESNSAAAPSSHTDHFQRSPPTYVASCLMTSGQCG